MLAQVDGFDQGTIQYAWIGTYADLSLTWISLANLFQDLISKPGKSP